MSMNREKENNANPIPADRLYAFPTEEMKQEEAKRKPEDLQDEVAGEAED